MKPPRKRKETGRKNLGEYSIPGVGRPVRAFVFPDPSTRDLILELRPLSRPRVLLDFRQAVLRLWAMREETGLLRAEVLPQLPSVQPETVKGVDSLQQSTLSDPLKNGVVEP